MQIFTAAVFALLACATTARVTSRKDATAVDTNQRLPVDWKPEDYLVNITTRLDPQFNFDGVATIWARAEVKTKRMVFHQRGLVIDESAVIVTDWLGRNVGIAKHSYDSKNEFHTIDFSETLLRTGLVKVVLPFRGTLSKNKDGYYRSSYKLGDKVEWMSATKFDPSSARMAFPCFDEPGYKSHFTLNLKHAKEYKAKSNMPVDHVEQNEKGWVTTCFPKTDTLIPTNLVLFAVSKRDEKL